MSDPPVRLYPAAYSPVNPAAPERFDQPQQANRLVVLERFLGRVLASASGQPRSADLTTFAGSLPARAVYFLLDPQPEGGVEGFLTHTLARLVQQLSRSTHQQPLELEGQVRGRILWSATYKARFQGRYQPNRYVCGQIEHNYNTTENQLLLYLLDAIAACLRAVPSIMRQGLCYLPEKENTPPGASRSVVDTARRLGRMESALQQAARSPRLRQVERPAWVDEFHLLRAEAAPLDDYARLARLYRRYRDLVLAPGWPALYDAGRRVLPLPAGSSGPAEPWLQLAAAAFAGEPSRTRE